jgi:hypothetical protein
MGDKIMQLTETKLCIDCETLFTGNTCPHCDRKNFEYLEKWVPSILHPSHAYPTEIILRQA